MFRLTAELAGGAELEVEIRRRPIVSTSGTPTSDWVDADEQSGVRAIEQHPGLARCPSPELEVPRRMRGYLRLLPGRAA